ncbi:hypothetical protein PRUPE_6G318900 [Prunus persica]|uniref:RNA ligase/cyclic nucleotide phosphodiesterase family protein n=1 Tax=Prunus persica TaxID=3760 RepID=M5WPL8_PRUPE|nr:hypothetical protein PRUPE_6G318900 [Prunus persica]
MRVPVENQDVQEKMHRYAVWAIPPNDVVRRIKKVTEGLRAEFGGPQIEPHITIVGSILLSHERAVEGFTEACESFQQHSFKVGHVATRKFFYQCVSLFIHPSLYANLTEEERIKAQEKVTILNRFELYKTKNEDRDQQS